MKIKTYTLQFLAAEIKDLHNKLASCREEGKLNPKDPSFRVLTKLQSIVKIIEENNAK